jgi:hypothetical protein
VSEPVTVVEALRRVEIDLAEARAQLRAAQGRVGEILAMQEGLRLASFKYADLTEEERIAWEQAWDKEAAS